MPLRLKSTLIHNKIMHIAFFYLVFLMLSDDSFARTVEPQEPTRHVEKHQIVVTLKPLYSLTAHISDGISTPLLLVEQLPTSHHYNLRPSQRKQLADADTIIWFGWQLEPYLDKIITQEKNKRKSDSLVISAMQAAGLTLLKSRSRVIGQDVEHLQDQHTDSPLIDPHIWLSSRNAIAISRHIAQSLIRSDPENSDAYKKNLAALIEMIEAAHSEIKTTLENVPSISEQPFIAYHDAFQYFEDEHQLDHAATVSHHGGAGPGLKHLREISSLIQSRNIRCLVYQQPEPALVEALVERTSIKAVALDPQCTYCNNDKQAWFDLMHDLATGFEECLRQTR